MEQCVDRCCVGRQAVTPVAVRQNRAPSYSSFDPPHPNHSRHSHHMLSRTMDTVRYSDEQRAVLISFRDSAIHGSRDSRAPIENLISQNVGLYVENLEVYRVCRQVSDMNSGDNYAFVSTCVSRSASETLFRRPPDPFADKLVKITVTGVVLPMVYDDPQGAQKAEEDELIVPLACITECEVVGGPTT
jgi:hypothetical protein